ncbi:vitamin B12 transporter [Paraperlucidibaca baekdonensis]|uniref:Vitamin B12 transporter n=1 Tax=Paraperlucidibaca baekdonensis TaxID=748120 RepID=A0A3E0H425_9GAMM|nr:TonB-dependent receptor [Paraperlucidibaca baekdonensis]REH37564.1 vitamin B12 transporter [Paraperlucidibaca baekdonensis]
MKHLPLFLAPIVAFGAFPALAASTPSLDEVVITASRSLEQSNARLDAATVITRADIEQQQAATLADILQNANGIAITPNGGSLTATGVFLRGFAAKQVLVLIDGVRANDSNVGQFDFSLLRADDIERVEVLRGGYSSQYGSDAMGGVIHIFTRRGNQNSISVRAGSYGTLESTVNLNHNSKSTKLGASFGQLDTQGFNAGNENFEAANFFVNSPDKDGGRQRTARLFASHEMSASSSLDASAIFKEQRSEYDDGETDGNLSIVNLAYETELSKDYKQSLSFGHNKTLLSNQNSFGTNKINTLRNSIDWLHTIKTHVFGTITGGLNASYEKTQSSSINRSLNDHAAYLINENYLGDISYRLSGRYENHEQWGVQNTGAVRIGYAVSTAVDVYAGYGTNFRAPTAAELFDDSFASNNPNLRPETSRQHDIGAIWRYLPNHKVSVNMYRTDVQDLINFGPGFKLANTTSVTLEGVELDLSGKQGRVSYSVGVTRARSKDENTGAALLRRPRLQLNAHINYAVNDTVTIGAQHLSRNKTDDFGGRNDGFATFNAYAQWQILKQLNLGLRLDNITDKDYELAKGYRMADRSGYVTANYRF